MIEVILDKSLIYDFGDITVPEGRLIEKILLNDENIFIINSLLLDYFDKNVGKHLEKWKNCFTYLSDNNKLKPSINNTLDTNIIFGEAYKVSDFVLVAKNSTQLNEKGTCYLKDTSNSNLLLKELLQTNKIILRSSNFADNLEIKSFFQKLFDCSKTSQRIRIVARYNNFDCDLILLLKNKFIQKTYWTTRKNPTDPSMDYKYLKNQLGNNLFVYAGNKTQIHERKFIIESLVVEFDDDFNKITSNEHTWTCNCIVDKSLSSTLLSKEGKLTRIF